MSRIIKVLALCSLLTAFQTTAITVDEAKETGLLGETLSGYLAPINTSNQEATKLAAQLLY